MSSYLARASGRNLIPGKFLLAITLAATIFLLLAAVPMAQAKEGQVAGAGEQIKVYQERRGVTRFEEYISLSPELGAPPGAFYKANVYAFNTKDGIVLVDCGVEDLYGPLMAAISTRFDGKPVVAVLLTHGHADHAGAGHYFVETGISVYAPAYDAFLIQMGMQFPGVSGDFSYTGYMPTAFMYGGETLFGLGVLPTPGHTYGSVSFVDAKSAALFSADTTICYASDDVSPLDMTNELELMTMMAMDDASLQMQLGSLNALMGLSNSGQVDTMLPGHNLTYKGNDVRTYIQNSIDTVTQMLMY